MKSFAISVTSLSALALLLLGAASPAFAQEALKIGYVDMSRALMETEDGRKARADLKKVFEAKQKELDEQQNELKKSMEDLEKKRTLLPADKVKQIEGDIQGRLQKVQQTYMRHQQDLSSKEQEATGKIVERMQRIIAKISVAENFTMVFDRGQAGLIFAKPHLDLTNEVIRRYNAGEGKEAGGTASKPAGSKAPAAPAAPKK